MPVVKRPAATKTFAFDLGLTGEEWDLVQEILGRLPNELEVMMFRIIFDERFSAKSSRSLLKRLHRGDDSNAHDVRLGAGECPFDDKYNLVFAMSPEPFPDQNSLCTSIQRTMLQTTVDVMAKGAKPLGTMNLMGLGSSQRPKTAAIIRDAMRGAGRVSHGSGIPIIDTALSVYPEYDNGSLLNSFTIGIKEVPKSEDEAEEGGEKKPAGNLLVYIGKPVQIPRRARRDEMESEADRRLALQVALSPAYSSGMLNSLQEITSRDLFCAMVRPAPEGLVAALVELGAECGKALNLDLERLPISDEATPEEVLFSRVPQSVLMVCTDDQYRAVREICKRNGIDQAICGSVLDTWDIQISKRHDIYARIPLDRVLDSHPGREYELVEYPPMIKDVTMVRNQEAFAEFEVDEAELARAKRFEAEDKIVLDEPDNLDDVWVDLVTSLNLCSRHELSRNADRRIGGSWLPGVRDASVCALWHEGEPGEGTFSREDEAVPGIAVAMNDFGIYVKQDYYLGTVLAIAEAMRRMAAVGAEPIALSHCLNFGNPNNYLELCALAEATRALTDGCRYWHIPIVSDAIDLEILERESGRFPLPTLVMTGKIADLRSSCRATFADEDDRVLLFGTTRNEISCSEYAADYHNKSHAPVPEIDFDFELEVCRMVRGLVNDGLLKSAHSLGSGGLGAALAESCFNPEKLLGASLTLEQTMPEDEFRKDAMLFSESPGRFLVSCSKENEKAVRERAAKSGVPITGEGETGGRVIAVNGVMNCSIRLATAYRVWANRLQLLVAVPYGTPQAVVPMPVE